MIDLLNNCLRHLLLAEIDQLTDELQIGFQPPDDAWRSYVSTLTADGQPANAVNAYLVELRENASLRSNAATRRTSEGLVLETPMPRRLDCRYLLTAWSPAPQSPAVEPTLDEHALLYQVAEALMRHDPLVPARVYAPDPVPAGTPESFATAELPIRVLPPEGFPKQAEFWGTMGSESRWRPSLELVVTLPVVQTERSVGALVTTRIVEYRRTGELAGEIRVQIGGLVLDATSPLPDGSPAPVSGAWVGLEDSAGRLLATAETDAAGAFDFVGLGRASYRLRTSATGLGEVSRAVSVPSPSGEYDLRFE